jgi:hypothetical protein
LQGNNYIKIRKEMQMQTNCKQDANSETWSGGRKTILLQRVSSLEVKPNLKSKAYETSNVSDGSGTHECAASECPERED